MERLEDLKQIISRINTDPMYNNDIKESLEKLNVSREDYLRYCEIAKEIYRAE